MNRRGVCDNSGNVPPCGTSKLKFPRAALLSFYVTVLFVSGLKGENTPDSAKVDETEETVPASETADLVGHVAEKETGTPISEGLVSIELGEEFGTPLPEEGLLSAEIDEDGSFEIVGIPLGEYTLLVTSPGYMPYKGQLHLTERDQTKTHSVSLTKAAYISGFISNRHGEIFQGEFDYVVSPPESQTTPALTSFDAEDKFRIGPFAHGAVVELTARTSDGRRSWPMETSAPNEDFGLWVERWVRVFGTVLDQVTGEPVPEFSIVPTDNLGALDQEDPSGRFSVVLVEDTKSVGVTAPGYLFWTSGYLDFSGKTEYDLGTIELERSAAIEGRVVDQRTGEPIEGAVIRRRDGGDPLAQIWNVRNVTATTNANGEFVLDGIPMENGVVSVTAKGYTGASQPVEDVESYVVFELGPLGSISGTVVSLAGEPVVAWVNLGNAGIRSNPEDGSFRFNVAGGTYRLHATGESGMSDVQEVTVGRGQSVDGVRLTIEIVARIYGVVAGLKEGETARTEVGRLFKSHESNGPYELRGLTVGEHVVVTTTSRDREIRNLISMDEGTEVHYDIVFARNSSLYGRVLSGEKGMAYVEVTARSRDTSFPSGRTTTIADGSYRIEGLGEGPYLVEVPVRKFKAVVDVESKTEFDISLGANVLSGNLRAEGSVRGARLILTGIGANSTWLSREVDATGSYRFEALETGTYVVKVTHPDYAETSQEVELTHDVTDFDIYLEPSSSAE